MPATRLIRKLRPAFLIGFRKIRGTLTSLSARLLPRSDQVDRQEKTTFGRQVGCCAVVARVSGRRAAAGRLVPPRPSTSKTATPSPLPTSSLSTNLLLGLSDQTSRDLQAAQAPLLDVALYARRADAVVSAAAAAPPPLGLVDQQQPTEPAARDGSRL